MFRRALPVLLALLAVCHGAWAQASSQTSTPKTETAIFAGGCFWSVEAAFEKLPGVVNAESGFTGGHVPNPTYDQVSAGGTGHAEAVRVTYNPAVITYERLLAYFWHNIDPTVKDRQFCGTGSQFRTAIFYQNEAQHKAALASKAALLKSGVLDHVRFPVNVKSTTYPPEFQLEAMRDAEVEAKLAQQDQTPDRIQTEILPAGPFYLAEEAHQDYYKKNPVRFKIFGLQCGRTARLQHVWGKEQE